MQRDYEGQLEEVQAASAVVRHKAMALLHTLALALRDQGLLRRRSELLSTDLEAATFLVDRLLEEEVSSEALHVELKASMQGAEAL